MRNIVYIHGFNSSSRSLKARQLQAALQRLGLASIWHAPDLSPDPARAMAQLQAEIVPLQDPLLIGSSLGGFYATWLMVQQGLEAVLINPSVNPHLRLGPEQLGRQTNWHTGEVWELTREHLDSLAALAVSPPSAAARCHVWLETGDETLDYREAAAFYRACDPQIGEGGDHGYQRFVARIPELLQLAGLSDALLAECLDPGVLAEISAGVT